MTEDRAWELVLEQRGKISNIAKRVARTFSPLLDKEDLEQEGMIAAANAMRAADEENYIGLILTAAEQGMKQHLERASPGGRQYSLYRYIMYCLDNDRPIKRKLRPGQVEYAKKLSEAGLLNPLFIDVDEPYLPIAYSYNVVDKLDDESLHVAVMLFLTTLDPLEADLLREYFTAEDCSQVINRFSAERGLDRSYVRRVMDKARAKLSEAFSDELKLRFCNLVMQKSLSKCYYPNVKAHLGKFHAFVGNKRIGIFDTQTAAHRAIIKEGEGNVDET